MIEWHSSVRGFCGSLCFVLFVFFVFFLPTLEGLGNLIFVCCFLLLLLFLNFASQLHPALQPSKSATHPPDSLAKPSRTNELPPLRSQGRRRGAGSRRRPLIVVMPKIRLHKKSRGTQTFYQIISTSITCYSTLHHANTHARARAPACIRRELYSIHSGGFLNDLDKVLATRCTR